MAAVMFQVVPPLRAMSPAAVTPAERADLPEVPVWAQAPSVQAPLFPEAPCRRNGWISYSLFPEGHNR